ncbi:class I SAM-dependent methyltransferase [Patescibacteria group bacterium]|nr:class I SAM-dependent methyltransferase [Patescibacteria group bacterium]
MNKQSYDKIAAEFSGTRGLVWQDIEYLFRFVNENDKILDAGCGNGRLLGNKKLKIKKENYFGIDFSENLIAEAQRKFPGYKFAMVDILNLSDKVNERFDVVFMISSLNHFPKEKHSAVIKSVKKVLAPGGKIFLVNWNLWNILRKKSVWRKSGKIKLPDFKKFKDVMTMWQSGQKQVPLYYYAFTKGEISRLLRANGFRIVENFYSKKGEKTNLFFADNIVTRAVLVDKK